MLPSSTAWIWPPRQALGCDFVSLRLCEPAYEALAGAASRVATATPAAPCSALPQAAAPVPPLPFPARPRRCCMARGPRSSCCWARGRTTILSSSWCRAGGAVVKLLTLPIVGVPAGSRAAACRTRRASLSVQHAVRHAPSLVVLLRLSGTHAGALCKLRGSRPLPVAQLLAGGGPRQRPAAQRAQQPG